MAKASMRECDGSTVRTNVDAVADFYGSYDRDRRRHRSERVAQLGRDGEAQLVVVTGYGGTPLRTTGDGRHRVEIDRCADAARTAYVAQIRDETVGNVDRH